MILHNSWAPCRILSVDSFISPPGACHILINCVTLQVKEWWVHWEARARKLFWRHVKCCFGICRRDQINYDPSLPLSIICSAPRFESDASECEEENWQLHLDVHGCVAQGVPNFRMWLCESFWANLCPIVSLCIALSILLFQETERCQSYEPPSRYSPPQTLLSHYLSLFWPIGLACDVTISHAPSLLAVGHAKDTVHRQNCCSELWSALTASGDTMELWGRRQGQNCACGKAEGVVNSNWDLMFWLDWWVCSTLWQTDVFLLRYYLTHSVAHTGGQDLAAVCLSVQHVLHNVRS